jgi:hypothetical protein
MTNIDNISGIQSTVADDIYHVIGAMKDLYAKTGLAYFKDDVSTWTHWIWMMNPKLKRSWGFDASHYRKETDCPVHVTDTSGHDLTWVGEEVWRLEKNMLAIYMRTKCQTLFDIANGLRQWRHMLTPENKARLGFDEKTQIKHPPQWATEMSAHDKKRWGIA